MEGHEQIKEYRRRIIGRQSRKRAQIRFIKHIGLWAIFVSLLIMEITAIIIVLKDFF